MSDLAQAMRVPRHASRCRNVILQMMSYLCMGRKRSFYASLCLRFNGKTPCVSALRVVLSYMSSPEECFCHRHRQDLSCRTLLVAEVPPAILEVLRGASFAPFSSRGLVYGCFAY